MRYNFITIIMKVMNHSQHLVQILINGLISMEMYIRKSLNRMNLKENMFLNDNLIKNVKLYQVE